eukprot:Lankesteria_metandrocarpae@DN3652_c0_g1_i2.p1
MPGQKKRKLDSTAKGEEFSSSKENPSTGSAAVELSSFSEESPKIPSFRDLGVCEELALVCDELGWTQPTKIQRAALPVALRGRDIIGIAETGSGKTAAFVIPILQSLLEVKQRLFGLVLAPTRELSHQIADSFKAFGSSIALVTAVVIGGMDMVSQSLALAEQPHVVIASPGRLVDHLENTKGFSLKKFKFLVLDEADRLLSMDFEVSLTKILEAMPKKRQAFLYSATMTTQVNKLKRASLSNPIEVSVSSKTDTATGLLQHVKIIPHKFKLTFLAALAGHFSAYRCIVFTNTCQRAKMLTIFYRHLGFAATSLHGQMPQAQRLGALNVFKAGKMSILVATEVGSRGLDIQGVDIVINYDVPSGSKDYVHRVGRTARAGKSGRAVTLVSQYEVLSYLAIEEALGVKLVVLEEVKDEEWRSLESTVAQAEKSAEDELREQDLNNDKKRKKGKRR